MKNLSFLIPTIILFILIACTQESTNIPDVTPKASSNQSADVFTIATGEVIGSANLHRKKDRITVNLHAKNLTPGDAYTLWLIIFNDPSACVEGCDASDLGVAAGEVLYGSGQVINQSGVANFYATLNEGDDSESINALFGLPDNNGLQDSHAAEIHLVLRTHGPAIPEIVDEQIGSYLGGCDNEYACEDIIAAVFTVVTTDI